MGNANTALMKLGDRIRSCRRKAGLSQTMLSFKAGFNFNYVGILEQGTKNVTFLALLNLSKALNVPISEIVEGIELDEVVSIRQRKTGTPID